MNETGISVAVGSGEDGEPMANEDVTKKIMPELSESEKTEIAIKDAEKAEVAENSKIRMSEKLHLIKRPGGLGIKICSSMSGGYLDLTMGEVLGLCEKIESLIDG